MASGISWAICKSAPHSRLTAAPAPATQFFTGRMPFLPPNQQRQSTEGNTGSQHCTNCIGTPSFPMVSICLSSFFLFVHQPTSALAYSEFAAGIPAGRRYRWIASASTQQHTSTAHTHCFYRAMLCIRSTSHGPVSVCLCLFVCVCLSQAGVLLKRLNVGSHKQHHTIPQGL